MSNMISSFVRTVTFVPAKRTDRIRHRDGTSSPVLFYIMYGDTRVGNIWLSAAHNKIPQHYVAWYGLSKLPYTNRRSEHSVVKDTLIGAQRAVAKAISAQIQGVIKLIQEN